MINSKDAIDLFETLVIFEKFLKYCKPKIRQGWQRRSLLSLMESLMSKDNHHKLRKEGLRLLLYYMEDQPEDSKDATDVYASVLQCDVFEPHSLPHPRILSESLCIGEDESGLIAALKDVKLGYKDKKKQPLPQDRSNVSEKGEMNRGPIIARVVGDERAEESELLNMITNNLMTLAGDQARQEKPQDSSRDNDRPPVEHMWSLFREQYLKRWFPHIGTIKSGIEIGTVELSPCPQGILEILMGFIAKVVSKPKSETDWIQTLQRLLLEDEFNREYVHEIIRQSMMSRDIKEPVGAVTTWLLANPTEKPLFLSDPSNFRQLLSRYLKYVHLGTLSKEDKIETQYQALQLAVFTYREVAFERNFKLQERDWVLIMDILLEIHQRYLVSDDKMSLGAKVKDFARLIIDTMLGVWIRSKTQSADQWQLLAAAFRTCHHSMQHAKSWTQFFVPMTHTMAREVYQTVLVTATEKDVVRGKKRKDDDPKKDRPKVAHSSSAEKVKYGHTASTSDVKATTLVSSDEIPDDLECIWSNALSDMQWTSAESYFIWKELLCILGDLELYKTPKVHFEIVKCLVRLWDMLEPLTSSQERLPYDYSGMIFKATLSSTEFFESVAAAIGCVCRIMCKRVQLPFQSASVAFFYQLLERLLPSQNDTIIYSIVTHSQSIFTTGLPGVYILIPTYMTCIKWLCQKPILPAEVLQGILSLLGSMLCLETRYKTTSESQQADINGAQIFCNLKREILQIWRLLLDHQLSKGAYEVCQQILWSLGCMNFHELLQAVHDGPFLEECFSLIVDHMSHRDHLVAKAATDCLMLIMQEPKAVKIDKDLNLWLIKQMILSLSQHNTLEDKNCKRELSISAIFKCLTLWLMAAPNEIVADPNIALRLSEIITETLHTAEKNQREMGDRSVHERSQSIDANDARAADMIQVAAENCLTHVLHHRGNFPSLHGPAMLGSVVQDPGVAEDQLNESFHYFSHKDSSILTVIDRVKTITIIIRDATGKYSWELDQFHTEALHLNRPNSSSEIKLTDSTKEKSLFPQSPSIMMSFRTLNSQKSDASLQKQGDFVEQVVAVVSQKFKHVSVNWMQPTKQLLQIQSQYASDQMKEKLEQRCNEEEKSNRDYIPTSRKAGTSMHRVVQRPQHAPKNAIFQAARLFLTSFGYFTFDPERRDLVLLSKTSNLVRDLRGLDKKHAREVAKIAVLYVGENQEDEATILKNEHGSKDYHDFITALGWKVDIETHAGYKGGLECPMLQDGTATYHCDSLQEVIFHEATSMASDPGDPKQLKKKRHIGNDHVHVVWNDNWAQYKWDTIGGDFGNAQISITPLPNGLYAIDVFRDTANNVLVASFGILQKHNVVTKAALAPLVRFTALNANRSAITAGSHLETEVHPYNDRRDTISVISGRHAVPSMTFEQLISTTTTLGEKTEVSPVKEPVTA